MTNEKAKKWDDSAVATLTSIVGNVQPVPASAVEQAAEALGVSTRSVAAKLRQLDFEVASLAKERVSAFSEDETAALTNYVTSLNGTKTYKEIAESFMDGKFNAKQIQGKLLALELTGSVKPAERVEVARTYTPEEESIFVKMATSGAFIEDIAAKLNKTITSIRGKALSLTRSGHLEKIPAQKESHAAVSTDPVDTLGDKISGMTVAEIAVAVDKTERGIKTMLTRRGIKVADYDGASKKLKAEAKTTAKAAA